VLPLGPLLGPLQRLVPGWCGGLLETAPIEGGNGLAQVQANVSLDQALGSTWHRTMLQQDNEICRIMISVSVRFITR
jgi:hypothetical protein